MTTCPDTEQVVTHDKCVLSRRHARLYLQTQFRFLWSIITCFISGTDTHHTQSITSKAFFLKYEEKRVQKRILQSKALWAGHTGDGCVSELLPVYMEFAFLIINLTWWRDFPSSHFRSVYAERRFRIAQWRNAASWLDTQMRSATHAASLLTRTPN